MENDTDVLIQEAVAGDDAAQRRLWENHRARLKTMVRARIDPFLASCVDPSDVVQDALAEAYRRLPDYQKTQPLPFYPWLRCLTIQRMALLHRYHSAIKRNPCRVQRWGRIDRSAVQLADHLAASSSTVGGILMRDQLRRKLLTAIESMSAKLCEVLTMHHLEELTFREIAEVTGVAESTLKVRHFRALMQLREMLEDDPELALW